MDTQKPLVLYTQTLASRLVLGTALFPSPAILREAVVASGAQMVTVALRRELAGGQKPGSGDRFFELISGLGVQVLPNTAGCRTARDAITTARMAREVFETSFIKLEVIANDDTLQPDVFGLVEAAGELVKEGFKVLPYTTEDLGVAERLLSVGCEVLMPWGSPIGTARGLNNVYGLQTLRAYFPGVPLIVDAGLGAPSHAAQAMELGLDGVLLNTAIARARDPVAMARAFGMSVICGRLGYEAGLMQPRDMASPSTPVAGTPFFDV